MRSCCPPGQNFFLALGSCATRTLKWQPSFLSATVNLEVVGGPIAECESNEDQKTFYPHLDASLQFELQPSGKLSILTSKGVYDLGHNYCFRNFELGGRIYESVRTCVPKVVPQVPGLPSIDNVTEVSFRKCCPVGQQLAVDREAQDYGCVNSSFDWLPKVLHGDPTELTRLSPEKARVEAGGDFSCPSNTVSHHLRSPNDEFYLKLDGRLLIPSYNLTIKPDDFCLDLLQSSSKSLAIGHVCFDNTEEHTKEEFEELCPEGVCVRKCCASQFSRFNGKCRPATGKEWQPTFHDGEDVANDSAPARYTVLYGMSKCDGHNLLFRRGSDGEDKDENPLLQVTGEIMVPRLTFKFEGHQCCLDYETYYDNAMHKNVVVETATCCQPKDLEGITIRYIITILLSTSAIGLFIMLAIYMMVPSLRNIHGKCLMSHGAALFIAFFLNVLSYVIHVNQGPGCDILGETEILADDQQLL